MSKHKWYLKLNVNRGCDFSFKVLENKIKKNFGTSIIKYRLMLQSLKGSLHYNFSLIMWRETLTLFYFPLLSCIVLSKVFISKLLWASQNWQKVEKIIERKNKRFKIYFSDQRHSSDIQSDQSDIQSD